MQEQYPFEINDINLVTIKQLMTCSPENHEKQKYFVVRAYISATDENIEAFSDHLSLSVFLTDKWSELFNIKANFSSDILAALFHNRSVDGIYELFKNQNSNQSEATAVVTHF